MPRKLRAQKIEIDLPTEGGETWVNATLQTVIKDDDYKTVQRIDRTGGTHRALSAVALETMNFTDPLTQETASISGAGVALLIKHFVVKWIQEDNGGTINELRDLITEE